MSFRRFLADLRNLLAPQSRLVLLVALGLLIDVAFTTALPLSLKFLIDTAIVPRDQRQLILIVAVLVAGGALATAAMIWRDGLYAQLGAAVLRDARERLFVHVQRLSLQDHAAVRSGDLMARFTTDLGAVEHLVVGALPNVFGALLSLFMLGGALFALDPRLALAVAVLAPLCWIGPRWLLPRAARLSLEARRRDGDVLSLVQENLDGQASIKALGLEARNREIARQRLQAAELVTRRFNFASYLTERLPNVGMLVLHVAILVWGAQLAFDDQLSVGTLVAFNAVLLSLAAAVATLTSSAHTFLGAAAGLRRVRELMDQQPSVVDRPDAATLDGFREVLRYEHVSFSHGERPVLRGLSLEIERGQSDRKSVV
jgi:ATP-binding cassette subfamily B protein